MKNKIFLWIIFILFVIPLTVWGATKITELTEDTSPSSDDLVVTVNNPGGTPATRKATMANLTKGLTLSNAANADLGDISISSGSWTLDADVIDQSNIADNAIQEEHLKAVDAASDEECLTYEVTTGDFEWQSCGVGDGNVSDNTDEAITGNWEIQDNILFDFGNDADWGIEYAEGDEDSLVISTTKENGTADDNALIHISVDTDNTGMDADQEVFEIGKGAQDDGDVNFTELLALDEDGDLTIAGTITTGGGSGPTISGAGDIISIGVNDDGHDVIFYGDTASANMTWDTSANGLVFNGVGDIDLPADSVDEADLKAVDAAGDEECLTYEVTTGDFEWQTCGAGGGAFSDAADPIVQNTTTKDVHVGDGAGTLTGKFEVGGDADQPQVVIEAFSTQTDDVFIIQNDADTEVFSISGTGATTVGGTGSTVTFSTGSVTLDGATADTLKLGADDDGHDFIIYGDTASHQVLWDTSDDALEFAGGANLLLPNGTASVSADCDAAGEAGRIWIDTDGTSGQQLFVCEGVSGWVKQGDGTGAGSGAFSDAADPVVLNTTTKDVVVGAAQINTSKFSIDGDADQVQLSVQAHSAQADSVVIVENSAGTEVFNVDNDGTVLSAVGYDCVGAVDCDFGSADVTDILFTTDGTGDAEVVLPNDSIGPAEIDSTTGAYDFGGVTSLEIPNAATDQVLDAAGEIGINTADEQISFHSAADGEISGEASLSLIRHLSATFDPAGWYDQESTYRVVPLMTVGDDSPEGIQIVEWEIDYVGGDPTTELDADIMCDTTADYNPAAGATVMDVIDTTTGASAADTGFDSATCANGSKMYVRFGADPTDANVIVQLDLWFYNEED